MLCVHYSIMFALLETGQSTTLHVEQLSSDIPLKLVQEDKNPILVAEYARGR